MDWGLIVILVIFAVVLGPLLFRWFKFKSFSAAMFGVPIRSTVGEISLQTSAISSSVLKVHALGAGNGADRAVGLQLTSKAPMAVSTMPITLTVEQAQQLSILLQSAARA
jgi:hypothetical protein